MPTRRCADMALIGLACVAGGLIAILVALRLLALAGLPGLSLYHIPSGAMTPTIVVGDQVVAVANLYAGRPAPRGQVVVFKVPVDRKTDYIKRVIGLAGDRVQVRAGRLYINDALVDRRPEMGIPPGLQEETAGDLQFYREFLPDGVNHLIAEESDNERLDETELFVVPPDHVFVMGDNRDDSADSRVFGYVPLDLLRDKPLFIYWSTDASRIGTPIE